MSQRMTSAIREEVVLSDTRQGNTVIIAVFQQIIIRILSPAEYKAGNLAGGQLIIHLTLHFSVHGIDICLLHVSYDLYALSVKVIEKSGKVQRRTVYIWMGQYDLIRINLRCGVAVSFFSISSLMVYSMHGIITPCVCSPHMDAERLSG